ncbi:hypothetical protein TNCV_2382711 [Trichonephila clavipes]|nr:hypothetical protein TNCV_2382711 [Trichonephila clavipes]
MPSPVQFNCDAHDTIANGQYGAVWSMGHTQQPNPVSQKAYDRINAKIADISEALANASMKKAAAEEKLLIAP